MTISKETLSFVLCAVISIFGCNNGNDAEDLLMIPAESSDAQGSPSGGNEADTIEVGATGQFSDASVPSGDATTESGNQPCVVNTQQFVPDLNISGSQARIEDILLSDDEIYLMLRVDDAVYVQKFERDGTPIQPPLFLGNGADTPGEFAVFGGALVVTVGRNEQTAINFMRKTLEDQTGFQPMQPPQYRGQPVYGAHPSITRIDDSLVASWRDFRMESPRYGQTGFYYSIRAVRFRPEDVDHEIYITPDDPDIAPLAGIQITGLHRVENRAAVYAAKRRNVYYVAVAQLPRDSEMFRVAPPTLYAQIDEDWWGDLTVFYEGSTAAVAWRNTETEPPGELRLQIGPDMASEGEVISQNADFAQMVGVNNRGYLVWADRSSEGLTWRVRDLENQEMINQDLTAPTAATGKVFVGAVGDSSIEVISTHRTEVGAPVEIRTTTLCL